MQDVFIVTEEKYRTAADRISDHVFVKKIYESPELELTESILLDMARNCRVDYFYVIATAIEIKFPSFDFSYKPETWDSSYVNIWNNDKTVRLFNKHDVLKNPAGFTDAALAAGDIKLKNIGIKIFNHPVFDIIFLSYDEPYADANFEKLKARFPRAKRLHHLEGILYAHKCAAKWAEYDKSEMFYIVDADAEIMPDFDFDYQPPIFDRESVHVWHSKNPVNDLEYGYGGIKLFPTQKLIEYEGSPIDFTTSMSSLKVMEQVSNITHFNSDPFSSWRSAFRECAKLASKIIPNQDNTQTEERLHVWCTVGADREFGDLVIQGANEGAEFGKMYANQPEMLGLINDFSWLEKKFSS